MKLPVVIDLQSLDAAELAQFLEEEVTTEVLISALLRKPRWQQRLAEHCGKVGEWIPVRLAPPDER